MEKECKAAAVAAVRALRIVGIYGSPRKDGFSRKALSVALQGAKSAGAETELIDLVDLSLPFSSGNFGDKAIAAHPGVEKLSKALKAANGIIVASPEYHGSYTGMLKNALDLLGFEEFEDKMVGLIGVSGGLTGGLPGIRELRGVFRALHSWVLPSEVCIGSAWKVFGLDGKVSDGEIEKRLMKLGQDTAIFSMLHLENPHTKFIKDFMRSGVNPGAGTSKFDTEDK